MLNQAPEIWVQLAFTFTELYFHTFLTLFKAHPPAFTFERYEAAKHSSLTFSYHGFKALLFLLGVLFLVASKVSCQDYEWEIEPDFAEVIAPFTAPASPKYPVIPPLPAPTVKTPAPAPLKPTPSPPVKAPPSAPPKPAPAPPVKTPPYTPPKPTPSPPVKTPPSAPPKPAPAPPVKTPPYAPPKAPSPAPAPPVKPPTPYFPPPKAPAPAPTTPGRPITKKDCVPLCEGRCKLHSRIRLCMRACTTCCDRCKCVPPGTYGNREKCGKCYTDMRTRGNRYKCP